MVADKALQALALSTRNGVGIGSLLLLQRSENIYVGSMEIRVCHGKPVAPVVQLVISKPPDVGT